MQKNECKSRAESKGLAVARPVARSFYHAQRISQNKALPTRPICPRPICPRPICPRPLKLFEKEVKLFEKEWGFSLARPVRSSWLTGLQRWEIIAEKGADHKGDKNMEESMWFALAQRFAQEDQREHIAAHMENLLFGHYPSQKWTAMLALLFDKHCGRDAHRFVTSIDSPAKQTNCRLWLNTFLNNTPK